MTTQKPEKYIHADDRSSHIESIYPAVIRHEKGGRSTLRWWTELAGFDVEIGLYDPKGVVLTGIACRTGFAVARHAKLTKKALAALAAQKAAQARES